MLSGRSTVLSPVAPSRLYPAMKIRSVALRTARTALSTAFAVASDLRTSRDAPGTNPSTPGHGWPKLLRGRTMTDPFLRIRESLDENLFVEAGAGTGKTK